ncbi:hypothetical protein FTX61_13235 [Nitriliruptoraceae bacterium ZYF776]|nr:hypothetical protein [Profundirhabdus halotolerans]
MDIARRLARTAARLLGVAVVVVATAALLSTPLVPVIVAGADTVDTVRTTLLDPPPLPDQLPGAAQLSTVHGADGARIADLAGSERREPVPWEDIPEVVVDAVVATEDADFFEHRGVDHSAITRAAARNLRAGGIEEGASTITQQYVRMTLLDPEQTIQRKLHEILLAVELERERTKEEILEGYLNRIYLGQGIYGIGTAAEHYFSKSLDELDVAEAATLAGTIRAPAVSNAVDDPDAALRRRDVVITQMERQGRIDATTADEARARELELDLRDDEVGEPFWIDMVKRLVYDPRADLQPGLQEAVGASVEERVDALFSGGLRIETTLDAARQDHAEATLARYLDDPLHDPLGAVVDLDHRSGALRAVALGPREFGTCAEDEEVCEVTQVNPVVPWSGGTGRQSGSAFKPFIAAAALEAGLEDEELEYDSPSGEPIEGCESPEGDYEPHNYDRQDHGEIEIDEAMRRSTNTYFVQLARDVGIREVVASAQRHGLTDSPNLGDFDDPMCSIALGSAEVFPLELAVGYGTWANDGVRCDPYVISRILDADGEVLYEHEDRCERAVDADVARQMRALLREPVGEGGTASGLLERVGDDATGKTGTTNRNLDAWFAGSTGTATVVTWVGFERPRPLRDLEVGGRWYDQVTGGALPAPMWGDYLGDLPD